MFRNFSNKPSTYSFYLLVLMIIIAQNVCAAHFQKPESSNISSDFYCVISINGLPADVSDEVAFYDPQGIICGHYVVIKKGEHAIIHVYGDNPTTPTTDEGANELDVLSIRLWDDSTSKEYAGSDIKLGPMSTGSDYFQHSIVPPVWQADKGFSISIDTKTHFKTLNPMPLVCSYIGKINILERLAKPGDEVAVFDSDDVLCGSVRIAEPGKYGMLHVYGDDPETNEIDEGAVDADQISFKIWDNENEIEIDHHKISMTSAEATGSFDPGKIPPIWTNFKGYHLDLSATYEFQSVSILPNGFEILAGNSINLTAIYTVSDANTQLEGLSVRFYFDSSKLAYSDAADVFSNQLISVSEPVDDTTNEDNDTNTDQYLSIIWKGNNWPGQSIPLKLCELTFAVLKSAKPGVTYINQQCSETSQGYEGNASRIRLDIINPAATIYGNIVYSGKAQGTYYMGAWDASASIDWKTIPPLELFKSDNGDFLIRLIPGNYIFAAYLDIDQEGNLTHADIDSNEPFGFYSENSSPDSQNLKPPTIEIKSGDIKEYQITIYDMPVIQSFELTRERFPEQYPPIFPSGEILKAIVSVDYLPGLDHIQKIEISGPNIDNSAIFQDTGLLPDAEKNDGFFTSWVDTKGIVSTGPYTVTVSTDVFNVWQTKTIDGINLETPVVTEPDDIASTFVTFKWQAVENANHYQLYILETQTPQSQSDFIFVKPLITTTEYTPSFQELSLGDGVTYYYFIAATDADHLNVSYSEFKSFKTDDAYPSIIALESVPSETVKAGPLNLTIVFSERMNTSVLPSVYFTPGEQYFSGSFIAPNIWAGSCQIQDGYDGLKNIHISDAKDMAGNSIKDYTQMTFVIDTILPTISNISLQPESPVQQGNLSFTIELSEQMALDIPLLVSFGQYHKTIFGKFIDHNTWVGDYHITKGYDGIQTISVTGGYDLAGNAMSPDISHQFTVDTTPPAAPLGFVGERVEYQVNLSWQPGTEPDFKGYFIYKDGKRITNLFTQTQYSEIIVTGKTYIYAVTAIDQLDQESPFSQTYAVITESIPPVIEKPENGISLTDFHVLVRGSAEPGAIVDILVNNTKKGSVVARSNGSFNVPKIPISEGENSITAISTNTYGVKSQPSTAVLVINDPKPAAPQGLELVASDTIITLSWQASTESDIAGYNIYRHLGRQKRRLNDLTVTQTSFVDNHLTNGRTYIYSITALDSNGSEGLHSSSVQGAPIAGEEWAVE
ncbi:Fibronectin type III domain-containing protein [Candidatus Magnetomorum sp. HK-1]|nr:Fibronectin type III domain-containing protein [Candidatus Magnetomorum sp. HK-1]